MMLCVFLNLKENTFGVSSKISKMVKLIRKFRDINILLEIFLGFIKKFLLLIKFINNYKNLFSRGKKKIMMINNLKKLKMELM